MPGKLSQHKIERLLQNEAVGRIGFCADGRVSVVPLNYGYDGECIYAHSSEGEKIAAMRKHPDVCFEIDQWADDGSWKSVIVRGKFEEITGSRNQRTAMRIFTLQMARLIPNYKAMPSHGYVTGINKESDPFKSVVFRIRVKEKSGRFEER
jgi:uncharacterized protein